MDAIAPLMDPGLPPIHVNAWPLSGSVGHRGACYNTPPPARGAVDAVAWVMAARVGPSRRWLSP